MSNFWDLFDKDTQEESGGGGIVCRAKIEPVYKGFVAGLDQSDAYRVVKSGDKASKEAAKAEILALGAERAQYGVQICALRDSAVSAGKPVTWEKDRYFFQASWTTASKEVVVPSLKENGINSLPFEGWVRIGFKPDPFKVEQGDAGKTDADANGNPRFPQVAYITEVFKDEDAARAAIGAVAEVTAGVDGSVPEGWDAESWKSVWPELYEAKEGDKSLKEIADDYGVKVSDVVNALKDYIPL